MVTARSYSAPRIPDPPGSHLAGTPGKTYNLVPRVTKGVSASIRRDGLDAVGEEEL